MASTADQGVSSVKVSDAIISVSRPALYFDGRQDRGRASSFLRESYGQRRWDSNEINLECCPSCTSFHMSPGSARTRRGKVDTPRCSKPDMANRPLTRCATFLHGVFLPAITHCSRAMFQAGRELQLPTRPLPAQHTTLSRQSDTHSYHGSWYPAITY